MTKPEFQYLVDAKGKKTAVIIPIEDWVLLQQQLKKVEEYKMMESGLKRALTEMEGIKSGKVEEKTLEDFLNEC